MKKDFTQPFNRGNTTTYLLIEDVVSQHFVVFATPAETEEYGHDAYRTLHIELDERRDVSVTGQLADFLMTEGFALNSFRELARETEVAFSFLDDTPGNERDAIALYVRADITEKNTLFDKKEAQLLPLGEYADYLQEALFSSRMINVGIAKLLAEREFSEN
jgi:hypothetical protein